MFIAQNVNPTLDPLPTNQALPSITPTVSLGASLTPSITSLPSPTPSIYQIPDIVIHALLACPSAGPEFVQLKNTENKSIEINNWQLIDLANTKDTIATLKFSSFEVISIELSKVKLNNSGDQVNLYDQYSNLIDSVSYQGCKIDEWHYFHQPSPTPTENQPSISSTPTTLPSTNANDSNNSSIVNTDEKPSEDKSEILAQQQVITFNYRLPNIKNLGNNQQKDQLSTQNFQLTQEYTYFDKRSISYWTVASVIMGGVVLCLLGSFLIYEHLSKIN